MEGNDRSLLSGRSQNNWRKLRCTSADSKVDFLSRFWRSVCPVPFYVMGQEQWWQTCDKRNQFLGSIFSHEWYDIWYDIFNCNWVYTRWQ